MYHLSEHPGLTFLEPRVPDGPESDTPRVCVAPTILGCLQALWVDGGRGFHVYAIDEVPDVNNSEVCRQIDDAHITGEQWFTHGVPCRWVGYVVTVAVNSKGCVK